MYGLASLLTNMADTGNNLSSAAFAISMVALAVSLLQALQQYFSTAQGFRQCKEDVMGAWSTLTHSLLDLRNLRFETRFVAPSFILTPPARFLELQSEQAFKDKSVDRILPIGHPEIPKRLGLRPNLPSARVSWLALLERIERHQTELFDRAFGIPSTVSTTSEKAEEDRQVPLGKVEWPLVRLRCAETSSRGQSL